MAAMRSARIAVGSTSWVAEEQATALNFAQSEVEEFSYSARNEVEWLNEHMAEIFSENQINVAEIFKTPGKLRGRTPRTARKGPDGHVRQPLSDIFSATRKGAANPFASPPGQKRRQPKIDIAQDVVILDESRPKPLPPQHRSQPEASSRGGDALAVKSAADSGYHGSQPEEDDVTINELVVKTDASTLPTVTKMIPLAASGSPTQASIDETFQSAKEEQTRQVTEQPLGIQMNQARGPGRSPLRAHTEVSGPPAAADSRLSSPARLSPNQPSPQKSPHQQPTRATPIKSSPGKPASCEEEAPDEPIEDLRSPSEKSSPIRPVVRKSSLNFASLPAREPLATKKSLGPGMTGRTSQFDPRQSYYSRQTGAKGLNVANATIVNGDRDELDAEAPHHVGEQTPVEVDAKLAAHNKTYTQRLQDQISMLGKSQVNVPRPSKSMHSATSSQPATQTNQNEQSQLQLLQAGAKSVESPRRLLPPAGPSAPADEVDEWIAPPAAPSKTPVQTSSRPVFSKSYSTDVMDGVHNKAVAATASPLPRSRPNSPRKLDHSPGRNAILGHNSNASVPALSSLGIDPAEAMRPPVKGVSVSNPPLSSVAEDGEAVTPPKSPSRSFKESPLKQVKNKLSSILKSSKGLLASSAAISAEGKSSLLSPTSSNRLGLHLNLSTSSFSQPAGRLANVAYPDLTQRLPTDAESSTRPPSSTQSGSPRRTRASIEREKREVKEKERESKEARRVAEQMDKLERLREKEREKARVFGKEQEKAAETERQIAVQKEQERPAQESAPPVPPKQTPQATRTSPRRKPVTDARPTTANGEKDIEMSDAAALMPPPSVPRPGTSASNRGQPVKRPLKPTTVVKGKPAPTVIRVNTTSSQQSQFHPSNSVLSATLQDTFGGPSNQLNSKSSKASLQTKPSLQSLKSSMSSTGRPKALELAARKKEQEEREAQRKRDVKAEMERKRTAQQEEDRRQEQQRRLDAERQREQEKEQASRATEAQKPAQRQAALERAKLTMAPPPAVRAQPGGPPQHQMGANRAQEESGRPINTVLSNAAKATQKRPLPHETHEELARPAQNRNPPSYQKQDVKRMRMSDPAEDDLAMEPQPSMKGPPVRPSAGLRKDLHTKSMLPNGYAPAPSTSVTRDLFKTTVTAQHNSQVKAAHPLDMAQVSKAAIPFAPNPNPPGQSHKTPARPVVVATGKSTGKSAARSSPRFQNGDAIELPEIQTDDEDEEDDAQFGIAPWADSPELRRALMRQETLDPMHIFGPPGQLNMEEVFSKNKDRWHKFRARTSSANWSGSDRLTEEDIRKDLAARDKLRREGGWSYEMSRDLA